MGNVLLVVVLLVVATGLGFWWRARNGRYTPVDAALLQRAVDEPDEGDHERLTAEELGVPLGARATFVQFSSEVCTPCRRTAVVLEHLVAEHADLSHVEMDVVEHLDLVRRFSIMRTPTTLLLDARGVVVGRMSGATDRRHALTALDACPGGVTAR
ncbi:thioredoxin family protein [Cellulomonas sp. McL0617]|uniref:thioredoxin family protein n=1 Tax=Cellulomonas sp. McL0617 TaxID=3415675 RepID=UPI003CF9CEA7